MDQVLLKFICYREAEYIGVCFALKRSLIDAVRKCHYCKWSQSNKCWLIPLSRKSYNSLRMVFKGKAHIDDSNLREYLVNRSKQVKGNPVETMPPGNAATAPRLAALIVNKAVLADRRKGIDIVNWHVISDMEERLKLKAYGKSTIKTYLNEMTQLLRLVKTRSADDLTENEIRRYLVYCYENLKLSENTLHSRINALKFYFEQVLGRNRFF